MTTKRDRAAAAAFFNDQPEWDLTIDNYSKPVGWSCSRTGVTWSSPRHHTEECWGDLPCLSPLVPVYLPLLVPKKEVAMKTLTDSDLEALRCLAIARGSSTSMTLTKDTVLVLVEAYAQLAAEHALRVQIERERLETTRQATRLLNENTRLREALADIARGDYSDPLCQRTPEQRAREALAERDEAIVDALVKERTPQNPQRKPLPRREKK